MLTRDSLLRIKEDWDLTEIFQGMMVQCVFLKHTEHVSKGALICTLWSHLIFFKIHIICGDSVHRTIKAALLFKNSSNLVA